MSFQSISGFEEEDRFAEFMVKHNILNSASTLNGETISNAFEGSVSVLLIHNEKFFIKWCGHM